MTLSRGKGLPASATSIIPQQTCLSLCQEHSDACDAAFSRVQPLRADGTAKSNTRQRCPFTAGPCYQVCASFTRVHSFIFCSTRAYVQKPDSPLSHLKPHKHTIHPPPTLTGPAPFCRGFLMRNVTVVQNEVGHEPWCLLSKPKI